MAEIAVAQNYFAQWQRASTRRWSKVHWFRNDIPTCGIDEPVDDEAAFRVPPEQVITCRKCIRLNIAMQIREGIRRLSDVETAEAAVRELQHIIARRLSPDPKETDHEKN